MRLAISILFVAGGAMALVPSVVLLNQKLQMVRTTFGVFDISINGVSISNGTAAAIFGIIGGSLVAAGVLLLLKAQSSRN